MLRLSFTKLGEGRILLHAQGEITLAYSMHKLRDALAAVVGEYEEVVVDVSEVTDMDAAAAEMLVLAYAIGHRYGTTVTLYGLTAARIKLVLLVKLLTLFGDSKIGGPPKASGTKHNISSRKAA